MAWRTTGGMTYGSFDALRSIAEQHLPSDVAERWVGLLRPGFRLEKASDSDAEVGQHGGQPKLPVGAGWPMWEGHGPLSFVASVDLAALPVDALDIALPTEGTLLFFYFDGQLDDGDALVLPDDRESWAGARVIYVPADSACAERAVPEGLSAYPELALATRVELTAAEPWHPRIQQAFAPDTAVGQRYDHAFLDALWKLNQSVGHRIGGHASPVQNPVELEIAHAVLEGVVSWNDPKLVEEAGGWILMAQFDSDGDADMMWGDCGALYWLIRPEDLAQRRFERAMFTWQCC